MRFNYGVGIGGKHSKNGVFAAYAYLKRARNGVGLEPRLGTVYGYEYTNDVRSLGYIRFCKATTLIEFLLITCSYVHYRSSS